MKVEKTTWGLDGDRFSFTMPLTKIDEEHRTVSGFAILDNEDQQDDRVLHSASEEAFAKFRGNIREMHQPIAAGRLLSFSPKQFFDQETGTTYTGIYVTTYISKGAESTWQKVLDGTLTGFSIGGNVIESHPEFNKSNNKSVRVVEKYSLGELSLVDSPANQHANVFSIVKSDTGSVMKGLVADTEIINLFYCEEDGLFEKSKEDSATCSVCGTKMENAGWYEKGADENADAKEVVEKFLRQKKEGDASLEKQAETATGEGGVNMADEVKKEEELTEDQKQSVSETVEGGAAEAIEEATVSEGSDNPDPESAVQAEEVNTNEPDLEKMFGTFRTEITDAFNTKVDAAVTEVGDKISKSLETQITDLTNSVDTLRKELAGVEETRKSLTKRLDDLEGSTAMQKSVTVTTDDGKAAEKTSKKGLWSGSIL